ncbi:MAG: glycosyltransferase family 39 protein [Candidatus Aenigmarchaeota archaeon]|nr:glycosyltransferase family 39 protein [Candidatus Aenigmarchaeota archaeon]
MPYFEGISSDFISVAENLLEGHGFVEQVFDGNEYFYQPAVWQPPIYSLFVYASFLLFGKSLIVFKIMQILLLSLVPPALYFFSKKRLGEKYSLLLALITIFYLPNIRLSTTILSEVLFGPLLLASAMLFLEKRYFWSGIVLGIASLTRDFGIMFAPAFLIYLFVARPKKPVKIALVFIVALLLIVFPWMIRNDYHHNHLVISAPKIGISMWEGIGEFDTEKRFGAPWGDENLIKSENATSFLYPDPFSRDKLRINKAIEVIKNEPIWYAGIMIKRVPQFIFMNLGAGLSGDFKEKLIYNTNFSQIPTLLQSLIVDKNGIVLLLMWTEQVLVYLFAIVGTYFILRNKEKEHYLFIVLILIMLSNVFHHIEPRYFIPINYFVLFIAVYGMKAFASSKYMKNIILRCVLHGKKIRKKISRN